MGINTHTNEIKFEVLSNLSRINEMPEAPQNKYSLLLSFLASESIELSKELPNPFFLNIHLELISTIFQLSPPCYFSLWQFSRRPVLHRESKG
jgi:hypothetical protein